MPCVRNEAGFLNQPTGFDSLAWHMTNSKQWNIGHDENGFYAILVETPTWVGVLGDIWEAIVDSTDHKLCCNFPDALWDIPISEEKYSDGSPVDSIGSKLHSLTTSIEEFFWKKDKEVTRVYISEDVARSVAPDFVGIFTD